MINKSEVEIMIVGNSFCNEDFCVKAMRGFHIPTETEIFIYRNDSTISQMRDTIYERLESLLHKK